MSHEEHTLDDGDWQQQQQSDERRAYEDQQKRIREKDAHLRLKAHEFADRWMNFFGKGYFERDSQKDMWRSILASAYIHGYCDARMEEK